MFSESTFAAQMLKDAAEKVSGKPEHQGKHSLVKLTCHCTTLSLFQFDNGKSFSPQLQGRILKLFFKINHFVFIHVRKITMARRKEKE